MRKGEHHLPESIALMSANRRGKACGNKNAMKRLEVRKKSSQTHKGVKRPDMLGDNNPMRNPSIAAKCVIAVKEAMYRPEVNKKFSGPNHPNWHGGISRLPYCWKWTQELKERIRAFFDYQCLICNKTIKENGRELDCHHVYDNKQICCDDSIPMFAALCQSHHMKMCRDNEGWTYMLSYIIHEIYGGKSYLTKEEFRKYKLG